jgi:p-aminobenzoyl-glutamate transporter AbgT
MIIIEIMIVYLIMGFVYGIFCSHQEDSEDQYLDLLLLWLCIFFWVVFLWSDIKSFLKKGK